MVERRTLALCLALAQVGIVGCGPATSPRSDQVREFAARCGGLDRVALAARLQAAYPTLMELEDLQRLEEALLRGGSPGGQIPREAAVIRRWYAAAPVAVEAGLAKAVITLGDGRTFTAQLFAADLYRELSGRPGPLLTAASWDFDQDQVYRSLPAIAGPLSSDERDYLMTYACEAAAAHFGRTKVLPLEPFKFPSATAAEESYHLGLMASRLTGPDSILVAGLRED